VAQGSAAPQLFAAWLHAHVLGLVAIKQIGPLPLCFDSLRGGADETFIILNTHIKVLHYIPLRE